MLAEPSNDTLATAPVDTLNLGSIGGDTPALLMKPAGALYAEMGLPATGIPGLAKWRDRDRQISGWDNTPESRQFFDETVQLDNREPLKPSWHQVVGVRMASETIASGLPFFLFDGVGLGKTLQSVGVMLLRRHLLDLQRQGKALPPAYGTFMLPCVASVMPASCNALI